MNFLKKLLGLDEQARNIEEVKLFAEKLSSKETVIQEKLLLALERNEGTISDQKDQISKLNRELVFLKEQLVPPQSETLNFDLVDPLDINTKNFSFEVNSNIKGMKKKIDANTDSFLRNLGSNIPNLISNGILANSYSFVFPKGVSGAIMQLANGQGTAIMQGGKILKHGAYVSNLAIAGPLLVINISSMIIRQHYLNKINENLKEINQKLDDLLELEFIKKQVKIESIIYFLQQAYIDFPLIEKNQNYKNAILTNLISANRQIIELIEFYKKSLKFIKNDKTEKNALNLKYFLVLHELYYQGKLLEFKYASEYNDLLINNLKEAFWNLNEDCTKFLRTNKKEVESELALIQPGFVDKILFRKKDKDNQKGMLSSTSNVIDQFISEQNNKSSNVIKALEQFQLNLTKRQEFVIENGELYEVLN